MLAIAGTIATIIRAGVAVNAINRGMPASIKIAEIIGAGIGINARNCNKIALQADTGVVRARIEVIACRICGAGNGLSICSRWSNAASKNYCQAEAFKP